MADWKVSKEVVEVLEHPNANALEIVRAGEFQLVSRKGTYKTGDVVIVAPDKSILSNGDMIAEYEKYLSGAKKNRVKSAQLRGEISQGITWPTDQETLERTFGERVADLITAAPLGKDISELLGITKYEPPIPTELRGQVRGIHLRGKTTDIHHSIYRHDVYQWGAFSSELEPDENVLITEKIHGSLCSYTAVFEFGDLVQEVVSSKGLLKQGIQILEDDVNAYWQGVRNTNLKERVTALFEDYVDSSGITSCVISVTGELVPVQKGFTYGKEQPEILVYDLEVDGVHLSYKNVLGVFKDVWVPVLYTGPLKDVDVYTLAKGREQVSGKELSIREGIVVTPEIPRRDKKGNFNLALKVINPAYSKKETGEEIN